MIATAEGDLEAIALALISRYGLRASSFAAHEALKARDRREPRRMEAWRLIADAVDQLLAADP
jgi:hypothetical protein